MKRSPGFEAALDAEREDRALTPRGRYFCPRSYHWLDCRPGYATHSTSSRASSHCATASAFCECRSMRRLSVSRPWRNRNELNGEIAAPMSRWYWSRALRMYCAGRSGSGSCENTRPW